MTFNKFFTTALLLFCKLAVALADCPTTCYRIEPGTIASIVCADVVLTLSIVIATYRCASLRRQKTAEKVYMNVRANLKT